jgi:sugar/nucleoside kinase (ribokinase family)
VADKRFELLGIGNAIVDVVAHAEDGLIEELGLPKGGMTLIEEAQAQAYYDRMGPAVEISGGSAGNTAAAFASLGGRSAYIGRVRDDQLGSVFAHDIRAAGVAFESRPSPDGPATARCFVFVTPDAQRTMATYLGACVELGPEDIDPALVRAAEVTYLEGYLWDRPDAKQACLKAARIAGESGRRVALTLSDPFCVDRWRDELMALIRDEVDILFANEAEVTHLFGVDFDAAVAEARRICPLAVLTRGPGGSVIATGDEVHEIAAAPVGRALDTTGAGDLYAAGFLYGLTHNFPLPHCGRLASLAAARIIEQYGARADRPLESLVAEARP